MNNDRRATVRDRCARCWSFVDVHQCSFVDDLLTAEQQAEKKAVGLFSNGTGIQRIVDMTGDSNKERAKGLLSVLQRNGRMEAVVEFVSSGSRFRVQLMKDNWIISFLLSSINCPRGERRIPAPGNPQQQKVEPAEPFGPEALTFSKEHFLQRSVGQRHRDVHKDRFSCSLEMCSLKSKAWIAEVTSSVASQPSTVNRRH